MAIRAVGVLSPGDMGHAVGLVLHQHGLRVLTCLAGRSERTRALAGEVGKASGLKMCYAAMTKGTQALATELLVAARAMGLEDALRGEQTGSVAGVRNFVSRGLANMPPKAHRWVGEMEEIAQTFEE